MRFLFRLVILGLAAVGAKSLYDRFAPQAAGMKGSAGDVLGTAKDAVSGVAQHAKDAASEVADDARQRASDVRSQASSAGQPSEDDTPTLANATTTPAAPR
jgi:hypothetical protein